MLGVRVVFAEELLPVYGLDEVATVVAVGPRAVSEALVDAGPIDVGRRTPPSGLIGALRVLPELVSHLLRGERPPRTPASLRLREISDLPPEQGGWVLLGEQRALGLVGKFWRPARAERLAAEGPATPPA